MIEDYSINDRMSIEDEHKLHEIANKIESAVRTFLLQNNLSSIKELNSFMYSDIDVDFETYFNYDLGEEEELEDSFTIRTIVPCTFDANQKSDLNLYLNKFQKQDGIIFIEVENVFYDDSQIFNHAVILTYGSLWE